MISNFNRKLLKLKHEDYGSASSVSNMKIKLKKQIKTDVFEATYSVFFLPIKECGDQFVIDTEITKGSKNWETVVFNEHI